MNPGDELSEYQRTVRELSDRIVEAQRPIRILDAVKWDDAVAESFFRNRGRELPPVDESYYADRSLGFDPRAKRHELHELERQIQSKLGQFNPVGVIMRRMCHEYQSVVRMLEARGQPDFSDISQELYGSPNDAFHAGDPTLAELGTMMADALSNIRQGGAIPVEEKDIDGEHAVEILQKRLNDVFPPLGSPVRVMISDGIVSDAAAGNDYIKIRKEARFSERDLRLLEVHEGWVHLGTTLNGESQPICTFLGKGPPSSTVTQEGLALLMEIIAFVCHPGRLRRVTNRIRAVGMAEAGADFLEVFRFFQGEGLSEAESYANAHRVFRGSTPDGGPFTKDICYSKGFVLVYNFLQLAVRKGLLNRIPLLFCGKTTLEDVRTLAQLVDEGLVAPPRILPPQLTDMNALAAWMCYASFLNHLKLERIEADYSQIL